MTTTLVRHRLHRLHQHLSAPQVRSGDPVSPTTTFLFQLDLLLFEEAHLRDLTKYSVLPL
jgi:hypothetical protein